MFRFTVAAVLGALCALSFGAQRLHRQPTAEAIAKAKPIIEEAATLASALPDNEQSDIARMWVSMRQVDVGDLAGASALKTSDWESAMSLSMSILDRQLAARDFQAASESVKSLKLGNWGHEELCKAQLAAGELKGATESALAITGRDEDDVKRARYLGQIAAAYSVQGDSKTAAGLLESALKIAEGQEFEETRDDVVGTVVRNQTAMGDFGGALQTAAKLRTDRSRNMALADVAEARAKAGKDEEAMQTAARIPLGIWRNNALEGIAIAQGERGKAADAAKTFALMAKEMPAEGKELLEYSIDHIAMAMATGGDVDAAVTFAQSSKNPTCRASILLALANLRAAKDPKAALPTLDLAAESAKAINDPEEQAQSFVQTAKSYLKLGEFAKARTCLDAATGSTSKLKSERQWPSVLMDVVDGYLQLGDPDQAVTACDAGRRPVDKGQALERIASWYLDKQQPEKTKPLVAKALNFLDQVEKGDFESVQSRGGIWASVAADYSRMGDTTTAEQVIAKYEVGSFDMLNAVSKVALALGASGDFKAALAQVARIPEAHNYRVYAMRELTLIKAKGSGADETAAWAHSLPSKQDRACALVALAEYVLDPSVAEPQPEQG